jgi:sugar transferase (PEP-CTERM/EpsH1 system associated)
MADYVRHQKASIRVLDMLYIDSEKWRAYAPHHRWPMRSLYRREADTLLALERQLVQDFDATLFVSEAEANRFNDLAPGSRDRIYWVDNGVDLARFSPKQTFPSPFPAGHTNIVFTGTMDYWPNVDAVLWFVDAVFPLVRQRSPSAHFWIVGAKPSRAVSRLRHTSGVTVTGKVPDVRPFLAHADVVVAPLRVARGIQNKVLEAMAMARPVVVTAEAFEGIRATPGEDLLVASTAEQMARSIARVLNQDYPRLGSAARAAIERNHDWATTLQGLDRFFSEPPTSHTDTSPVGRSALHRQNIHSITQSVLLP